MLYFLSTVILLLGAAGAFSYRRDILHPGFWTNLGFIGYAVGGYYFAVFGFDQALFLNLAGIGEDRDGWIVASLLIVLAGFLACNIGFAAGNRLFAVDRRNPSRFSLPAAGLPRRIVRLTRLCALLLIAIGSAYWLYMAHVAAGGVLNMFRNVAAYRYLVADAGISALPLRFAYAGIELWMLAWLSGARRPTLSLLFLPPGLVVSLSSGRISASVVFVFAALLAYAISRQGPVRARMFVRAFLLFAPLAVVFYFYRQYSSYAYIDKPDAFAAWAGSARLCR